MPVLITIPVVFFISLSLRAGTLPPSPLWDEFIPWWSPPADLEASFKASAQILAERGMDAETLSHLTKPIGPSLGQVDTTFVGPLALLGLNWANFELSGWVRKTNLSNEQPSEVEKGIAQQQKQRTGVDSEDQIKDAQSMRSRIVSRVVRMWTIALVPVAANVPSVSLSQLYSSKASRYFNLNLSTIITSHTTGNHHLLAGISNVHISAAYLLYRL